MSKSGLLLHDVQVGCFPLTEVVEVNAITFVGVAEVLEVFHLLS